MAECMHCHKPAGFLKHEHAECKKKYLSGWDEMVTSAARAITSGSDFNVLPARLADIASRAYVPERYTKEILIRAWERALKDFLDEGVLSPEQEKTILGYKERFNLTQEELDRNGMYSKAAKAGVLRDLMSGKLPKRIEINGALPFNLLKSEALVWVFGKASYYEERTRTKYVGRTQGYSVKIMKGLYYRTSAFEGHPIQTLQMVHVDDGIVGITNQNIYLVGPHKSFRVPYKKIVSIMPYADGIGFVKDNQTAKPQILVTGDGWFTHNLISNLLHSVEQ